MWTVHVEDDDGETGRPTTHTTHESAREDARRLAKSLRAELIDESMPN